MTLLLSCCQPSVSTTVYNQGFIKAFYFFEAQSEHKITTTQQQVGAQEGGKITSISMLLLWLPPHTKHCEITTR